MWAAQTTLLAPTVTLSPMVIGKKAMFPWQATNLDYTGFWTTILLQQMDFYHRHVALLIELEHPINACCQHVSTMSMMLDYFTTSVQRITERDMFIDFSTASSHTYSSTQLHDDSLFLLHLFAHFSPSKCLMSPLCLPAMFPPCTSCMRVSRRNFRRWSHVCLSHQRIRGYRGNRWPAKKSHKKHKKGPSKRTKSSFAQKISKVQTKYI